MTTYKLPVLPYSNPANSQQYADDIIAGLGDPETANNQQFVNAWVQSESATFPGYNGMGTSLQLPGSTPVPGNSAGVQEYPNLQEGITAAVDMMKGLSPQTTSLTPVLNKDLKAGNTSLSQMAIDLGNSGWDGSAGDAYDENAIAGKLNLGTLAAPSGVITAGSGGTGPTNSGISTPGGNASNDENGPTSSSTAPTGTLTGIGAVLQTISALMNPPGISTGLGGVVGAVTGSTEASIAGVVEGFAVRLFFAAGFAALAYIGVKTITTGNGSKGGGGPSIIEVSQKRQGIDLANRNLEISEANRQSRENVAAAQRAHEANQARLDRAAATRAANRAARQQAATP